MTNKVRFMDKNEVIERLNQLVRSGGKFKAIELDLKMPKNCLSRYASGNKPLPEKWIKPLSDYLENLNKKRVVLIEDKDGKFLFIQPDGSVRKCTLVWEDKEIKIPDENYPITVTPLRLKIKTVKDQDVPEKIIEKLPGENALDYRIRCEEAKKQS